MGTINYALKYGEKVDERFTKASLTHAVFNRDYDFTGVSTVRVYTVPTAPLSSYSMTGLSRYGTPGELEDTVQELTLTQDKAFTFTIDRRNYEDTMMLKESGRALRRQLDEVLIPEVDKYRIGSLVTNAGTTSAVEAITALNAYDVFLKGVTTLLDNNVPSSGTFAFIGTNFYRRIRQDAAFILPSDTTQNMLVAGQVGKIEGVPLIFAPSAYLPAGVEFILCNSNSAWAALKLADYKVHDNPPGINGWLVEGRVYHDCGVLASKKKGVYVHKSA